MKGLSLSFKNTFPMRVQQNPIGITFLSLSATNLVAWYDMSDASTMFTGPTLSGAATNGQRIRSVNNKAYDGNGASSTSLNSYIAQPNASTALQPVWTAPTITDPGYLTFGNREYLQSLITVGNVSTGKMGGVTLNHENHTISVVLRNDTVADSSDAFYFGYQNAARRLALFGLEADDDQAHYWPTYAAIDIDSGTAFGGGIESWTIVMGEATSGGADVRQVKIYRNGVLVTTSTVDYSAEDKDLTANSVQVSFDLGRSPGSANQLNGRMYEFLQWDKALSDVQLDQLNTYYGVKYGIS